MSSASSPATPPELSNKCAISLRRYTSGCPRFRRVAGIRIAPCINRPNVARKLENPAFVRQKGEQRSIFHHHRGIAKVVRIRMGVNDYLSSGALEHLDLGAPKADKVIEV